jgi:hypothetical protein
MFCNKCGSQVGENAPFCPNCGSASRSAGGEPGSPSRAVFGFARDGVEETPPPEQSGTPNAPQPRTESRALASLILGVLALFLSIVTGIPAIIVGHLSLSTIKKSSGQLTGESMAMAGLILGYISIALVPFLLMIAIPGLIPSRGIVDHGGSAANVRTLISAENTYSATYPKAGYATDLATLGPGGPACSSEMGSQKNACLLDGELGCTEGTSGKWCEKDLYHYSIVGILNKNGVANDFVISATPENTKAGTINFCASSDGIVRSHAGVSLSQPLKTVAECQAWKPL